MHTTHLGALQFGLGPFGAQSLSEASEEILHGSCCGEAVYWQGEADTMCSPFSGTVKQQF